MTHQDKPTGHSAVDLDIVDKLLKLAQKQVLDVGCGNGEFARLMASRGARVVGIEPDKIQAAKNSQVTQVANVELIESGADILPVSSGSMDAVILRFSMHHIPAELYPTMFGEIQRVLKPGGQLLVLEPLLAGTAQHVMCLYHDETKARTEAQSALHGARPDGLKFQQTLRYEVLREFDSYQAYTDHYSQLTYNSYKDTQVTHDEVKIRFAEHARPDGSAALTQPIRADLFVSEPGA